MTTASVRACRHFATVVVLASLLGLPVHAAAPQHVADVVDAALASHPQLVAAQADVALVDADARVADGAFDPVVKARGVVDGGYYNSGLADVSVDVPTALWGASLTTGWRVGLGDFPLYEGKTLTNDGGELRVGAQLPLLRNGPVDRARTSVARVEQDKAIARASLHAARVDVARAASLAYWEWLGHVERVRIARAQLALAQARDAQLAARAAGGDLAEIERTDNARVVAQRVARLAGATRALERAALELSLSWRGSDGTPRVPDDVDTPLLAPPVDIGGIDDDGHVDALLDEACAQRPELVRIAAQRRQWQLEHAWADNQRWPGLALFVSASQDLGGSTFPLSSSPTTAWAADGKSRAVTDVEAGVLLDLPIPARVANGRLEQAQAQLRRIDAQERLLRDRVRLEIDDARSAIRAATARIRAAHDEVAAAQAVEDAEHARFSAGDSTVLHVNLRELATADARLVEVDALVEAWRARVQLEVALARIAGAHRG